MVITWKICVKKQANSDSVPNTNLVTVRIRSWLEGNFSVLSVCLAPLQTCTNLFTYQPRSWTCSKLFTWELCPGPSCLAPTPCPRTFSNLFSWGVPPDLLVVSGWLAFNWKAFLLALSSVFTFARKQIKDEITSLGSFWKVESFCPPIIFSHLRPSQPSLSHQRTNIYNELE